VAISKYYMRNYPHIEVNYICTGTLISRNDVLTSEHCLRNERLTRMYVMVGSSYLDSGTIYYPEWWQSYDQWAVFNNLEIVDDVNDIAFLNVIIPDEYHLFYFIIRIQ
jgi:hypothetical protein